MRSTPPRSDAIGIEHMLNEDPRFETYLVTAPRPKRLVCTSCKATWKRMAAVKSLNLQGTGVLLWQVVVVVTVILTVAV